MKIQKKSVRNVEKYLHGFDPLVEVSVVVPLSAEVEAKLSEIGFSNPIIVGEVILPGAFGTVSDRNANGEEVPDKTQPMETVSRQHEWTRKEWRGRYQQVEVTEIVDVPYERYPRIVHEPKGYELKVTLDSAGNEILQVNRFFNVRETEDLRHAINLCLELFSVCEIRDCRLTPVVSVPERKLNWRLLPPGKRPWDKLKSELSEVRKHAHGTNIAVIDKRFEHITQYGPDFYAVGQGGFQGYVVFGFEGLGIYVLESTETNNATYILGTDWKTLSQLSKAELLLESLHEDRVVHRKNWFSMMDRLLAS